MKISKSTRMEQTCTRRLQAGPCKSVSLALVGAMMLSLAAHAQDAASSSTSLQEAKAAAGVTNKTEGAEKVDDMITNANLRALSGSLSTWSISSTFTYDGGTISSPFAIGRPNIAGASATSILTDLNGQVSVKYNASAVDAILVGGGIRKMAPFVSAGPDSDYYASGGKDVDLFDPTMTYQRIYKANVVQAVLQVTLTDYTRQDIQSSSSQNLAQNLSVDQENIIDIGDTGLSVGGSIGVSANRPTDASGSDYSRYQYWFEPYAEYKVNDLINLRSVTNLWTYEVYPAAGLVHDTVTQSFGVGFSVTRDVFIYPNIQFLPDNARADITNVGTTATINLF